MRSSVLLAVLGLAVLLLAGCTQDNGGGNPPASGSGFPGLGSPPQDNPNSAPDAANLPSYSLSNVASHNTPSDCWMAINGSVYNFTGSMMMQQNGNLTALCGTDATSSFASMMGRGGNFSRPGNFTRNGTSGNYIGGQGNTGSGSFNRTRGAVGGFGRMIIGKLE